MDEVHFSAYWLFGYLEFFPALSCFSVMELRVNLFMEPFMSDEASEEEDNKTMQEEENNSNDSKAESDESISYEENDSDNGDYSAESYVGDT